MTQLLEKAYSKVAELPETEQDAIAAIILDSLEDEGHWAIQFGSSQDTLGRLAEEALEEHRAGKTHPLDPREL